MMEKLKMETVEKRLYSVKETAAILNISPRSIYNAIHRRSSRPFPIKPKRVGRLVKFDIKDIEAYLDSL